MSGEITATPRKAGRNRWMVYVPAVLMPDGTRSKSDRKVVTAGSKNEAIRWGQERRGVLIEEHRRRRAGELEAAKPKAPMFAEFSGEWLERLRVQAAKGEKKRSSVEAIESTFASTCGPSSARSAWIKSTTASSTHWRPGGCAVATSTPARGGDPLP